MYLLFCITYTCTYQQLINFLNLSTMMITLSVTLLWSRESLFFNMFWTFASIQKSSTAPKQACILLLRSAGACWPLLAKWWKEFQASPSLWLLLSHDLFEWWNNGNNNMCIHLNFFRWCIELIYQFPKAREQDNL